MGVLITIARNSNKMKMKNAISGYFNAFQCFSILQLKAFSEQNNPIDLVRVRLDRQDSTSQLTLNQSGIKKLCVPTPQ